jgi:hypothetical protein
LPFGVKYEEENDSWAFRLTEFSFDIPKVIDALQINFFMETSRPLLRKEMQMADANQSGEGTNTCGQRKEKTESSEHETKKRVLLLRLSENKNCSFERWSPLSRNISIV